jgi:hypothetical protein
MADLTLRSSKGSPLSFQEVDGNFEALNQDILQLFEIKYDSSYLATFQEAITGVGNSTLMTPQRVAEAIEARASKLSIGLVVALSG